MVLTFKVSVYKRSRAFNIRRDICSTLGLRPGDSIHLIVRTPAGKELFNGRETLRSGTEIYGKDIASSLKPGSKIVVEASQPILLEAESEAESFYAQERAAGFQPNPEIRWVVERYAMEVAKEQLRALGFTKFVDTSKRHSYDYTCWRDGSLHYVEVKGTQGPGMSVILTKNEYEHWQKYRRRSVAVIVHDVKVDCEEGSFHATGGSSRVCLPWFVDLAALEPIQYKWTVAGRPETPPK
jgi:hypothetical protein